MTFRLSSPELSPRPGHIWLQLTLLIGFLLSLLIGLGALVGVYLLPEQSEETVLIVADPLQLVEPARIPPHLALLQLAGAGGDGLVRQAVTANERALAYSILLYDSALSPSRQANELVRLSRQYLSADDHLRGIAALHRARAAAIFALPMPPLERGQLLARIADGLVLAGDVAGGVDTALQAQNVAAQAAGLLPAQRAQLLESIEPLMRAHASPEQQQRMNELLRGLGQTPERVALISRLSQLSADYPTPPALAELRSQRMAAAQLLIDRILLTGGQDIEPERAALSAALVAEDAQRADIYAGWNDPALQLAQRHAVLLDYRDWLLVKARVAEGGFGVRLVGDWESQKETIRSALGLVMGELNALLTAQVDEDPDPASRAMLRLEVLDWLALQAELGFYPNAPLGDLSSRMEAAQAELESLRVPPDLPLFFDTGATPPGFRIARRYE